MTSTIVNVKYFGATGDGSTDDTANIQLAIDAAFGSASSPHGGSSTGSPQNRALYFPNGTYKITAPLMLTQVHGAHIYGDGKMATRIVNTNTSGGDRYSGSVFVTAGFSFGNVEHMTLVAAAPVAATFTGSISGNTLTVSGVSGTIQPGLFLTGASTALANSSMTWASTAGGTVTVTTVSPHGVPTNNPFQVTIAGASPSGYNGAYTATSTGASTFTYLTSNPGTETVPGTYSISIVSGVQTPALSGITWSVGTATATATAPHGAVVGTSFPVIVFSTDKPIYNGTWMATATSSTQFTYPLANNPGGSATFGLYGLLPTIITSGSGSTWAVSNSQNVASGSFSAVSRNYGVELTWDNTADTAGPVVGTALHHLLFRNVRFEGGDIGMAIGDGGNMGSEILFVGCDFSGSAIGVTGFNFNALDFTVLGGSFENCGIGIDTNGTSTFSYVNGVSFSGSTTCDIYFRSYDGMGVEGCNSTSTKFLQLLGSVPLHTKACSHTPASAGSYATPCQAFLIIDGCIITNAVLQGSSGAATPNAVYMRGNNIPGTFLTGSTSIPGPYPNLPTGPVMEFF